MFIGVRVVTVIFLALSSIPLPYTNSRSWRSLLFLFADAKSTEKSQIRRRHTARTNAMATKCSRTLCTDSSLHRWIQNSSRFAHTFLLFSFLLRSIVGRAQSERSRRPRMRRECLCVWRRCSTRNLNDGRRNMCGVCAISLEFVCSITWIGARVKNAVILKCLSTIRMEWVPEHGAQECETRSSSLSASPSATAKLMRSKCCVLYFIWQHNGVAAER